jgi:urease accessory protein
MTGRHVHRHVAPLAAAALVALFADAAAAHHVMGSEMPSTFGQGFLSGLGHPIIGLDHLAFIVGIGIAVGIGGLNLFLPLAFVGASALGVVAHVQSVSLPLVEPLVALSTLAIGDLVARGSRLPDGAWAALFALAGLFHGYAFGESIFGAETTPLAAYLTGLVVIQGAVAIAIAGLIQKRGAIDVAAIAPRLAGAAVGGIGFAILAGHVLPG